MSSDPAIIEESDVMLAAAAKMDLAVMRHAHDLILASDDAPTVGTLTNAYARASRCMRQNLALLARQKADRAKAEREVARERTSVYPWQQQNPKDLAVEERSDELQGAVDRVISAASDGDRQIVRAELALDANLPGHPPDSRMVEKQNLGGALKYVHQEIRSANVRELVCEDGVEMRRRHSGDHRGWKQNRRTDPPDHCGDQHSCR